jgi:hypothetical protein
VLAVVPLARAKTMDSNDPGAWATVARPRSSVTVATVCDMILPYSRSSLSLSPESSSRACPHGGHCDPELQGIRATPVVDAVAGAAGLGSESTDAG